MKQWLKTLILGLTSGVAVAAGGWAWKNCLEKKADELKQGYDGQKKDSQKKEG